MQNPAGNSSPFIRATINRVVVQEKRRAQGIYLHLRIFSSSSRSWDQQKITMPSHRRIECRRHCIAVQIIAGMTAARAVKQRLDGAVCRRRLGVEFEERKKQEVNTLATWIADAIPNTHTHKTHALQHSVQKPIAPRGIFDVRRPRLVVRPQSGLRTTLPHRTHTHSVHSCTLSIITYPCQNRGKLESHDMHATVRACVSVLFLSAVRPSGRPFVRSVCFMYVYF